MKIPLLAVIFFIAILCSIYSIAILLSRKHGRDLRVVWYFFSLSLVITCGIVWWAINTGAIDEHGTFHGNAGDAIKKVLNIMLDLNADIQIFATIAAVITVPQLLSYVLSGFCGCAALPLLIEESFRFFVWNLVKSFAVVSGILLPLALFGAWNHWGHRTWREAAFLIFVSETLILLSLSLSLFYLSTVTPEI